MYLYAKANDLIGKDCSGSSGSSKAGGVQCLVGGGYDEYNVYWSSSECSDYQGYYLGAWDQHFSDGSQYYFGGNKIYGYFGVRAVRAFNNSTKKQLNNTLLEHHSMADGIRCWRPKYQCWWA